MKVKSHFRGSDLDPLNSNLRNYIEQLINFNLMQGSHFSEINNVRAKNWATFH